MKSYKGVQVAQFEGAKGEKITATVSDCFRTYFYKTSGKPFPKDEAERRRRNAQGLPVCDLDFTDVHGWVFRVEAETVYPDGMTFHDCTLLGIAHDKRGWNVTDVDTGYALGDGYHRTLDEAFKSACRIFDRYWHTVQYGNYKAMRAGILNYRRKAGF